ncbi:gas vesicle protein GvpN [Halopelagius inordinatus]|uniref:Gas vesicle protein GvpN n=1 Tax=Halopelagius inordinatus TaxID=553467 RepID=A0A1I2TDZ9_9EURY|nr:gas vesicle protein GvpN [Halopelagius inordinatus]SFG61577.1 gas vesicle protein GvpN [Halopelagius inordinatus]
MTDGSDHKRKVRGLSVRSDGKETKRRSREKKDLDKQRSEVDGDDGNDGPQSAQKVARRFEPFVETDETEALVERIRNWWGAEQPVHLIGPTGCGKTTMAVQSAVARGRPIVWLEGDDAVDTAALVGEHAGKEQYAERDQYVRDVVKKKSIVRDRWVDNPLSVAAREGATLIYNEFSRSKPAANNVLLSAFEEGILERSTGRGADRTIDVHPDFRAILTSNSVEYAGVHRPQDALLDRLVGIHLGFYDRETEVEIVDSRVDDLDRENIEKIVTIVRGLREEMDVTVGTRAAVMAARGLTAFPPRDDLIVDICTDVLASKVSSREEVEELRDQIDSIVGGM